MLFRSDGVWLGQSATVEMVRARDGGVADAAVGDAGRSDAGGSPDAGSTVSDAAVPDAAGPDSALVDAAQLDAHSAMADSGHVAAQDGGGGAGGSDSDSGPCGCSTTIDREPAMQVARILLAAAWLLRKRRRPASCPHS